MPSYTVGPDGKTSTTYSAEEMGAGVVALIIIAPFAPILATGYYTFQFFHDGMSWHPLFCIIIAITPVIVLGYILYASRIFRAVYFGGETIAATIAAFYFARLDSDAIWASAAGLAVFSIGAAITVAATNWEPDD